ncbi:hypothetical protein L1887_50146 [Cichorium endivia]|nr:hypothetical protein L1887_50146 [Cichorium endivia]
MQALRDTYPSRCGGSRRQRPTCRRSRWEPSLGGLVDTQGDLGDLDAVVELDALGGDVSGDDAAGTESLRRQPTWSSEQAAWARAWARCKAKTGANLAQGWALGEASAHALRSGRTSRRGCCGARSGRTISSRRGRHRRAAAPIEWDAA